MKSKDDHTKLHRLPDSRFTRFITAVLRPFYRRKVIGAENIDTTRAAVFACNHAKTSGPVSAVIHMPVRFRPWINGYMLDREQATSTMMRTYRDKFMFLGSKVKRRLLWWLSGPMCHVLNSFEPIPVYKGMPKESAGTIELSVDALERGENLLIFPEKPSDRYDRESYKDFNTGFAAIGRAFYDRTGQCLEFYPVWTDQEKHEFRIGRPVTFDPSGDPRTEKLRISSELRDRMTLLKNE